MRELSRGGRRKNDVLAAAAAAAVAALRGDTAPVATEDAMTVLAMLDERRGNLTQQRTRTVNQLHALLHDLLPGGVSTNLTADRASAALTGIRPATPVERARKELARELIADIRALDARLKANTHRMRNAVADSGSSLPDIVGVGPMVAARLLGRTGRASLFPTSAAFAVYAGVAPIEIASGDKARHRLSREGDRKLNTALHTIALNQIRMPDSRGRGYYDRKTAEGHTHNEAMRYLKRRLADHVWSLMLADERRQAREAGPGGHSGATLTSSATGPTPTAGSSDKSLPEPVEPHPTTEPIPAT